MNTSLKREQTRKVFTLKEGYQFHINLMVLFNKIVDTGNRPFSHSNSVIFILEKKPSKKNYRPITINSVVGKLFIRKSTRDQTTSNLLGVFSDAQYAQVAVFGCFAAG